MSTFSKLKLLLPAFVLAALFALPASAAATLAYVKNPFNATVYVANDDGSGANKIDKGHSPRVSPDGSWVAYLHEGPRNRQELKLAPASGGPGKTLMSNFREAFYLTWSPDSKTLAALRGPELGKRTLVLIDASSGTQRVVAKGFFSGFSFAPMPYPFDLDSPFESLVYAKAGRERYPPRSDIFSVAIAGGKPIQLTHDHNSSDPLWGPQGEIVFVKAVEGKNRRYGPKNELFLMDFHGGQAKRLTHTEVPPLLQGLFPTDWSANGSRLLTEFQGQDTSYAVTVNPKTGAQRPVAGAGESGFVGTDLSSDGTLVLGFNGGFDPGLKNHKVQTVPYGGGKPKTLVKAAFEPSWSR